MSDPFYRAYEDRHRGSRNLIKSRLRAYQPFLDPLRAAVAPATAIDLGCGRGEWLELLGELGFDARGVDLDEGMLEACREHGLRAEHADAIQSLRALPEASMALVSAFHVVEHIPFDALRTLVTEALRVLKPGGLLIMETPNPENLVVGSSSFYQDPTHQRPIPPELLRFVTEFTGFVRNKVVRLQEETALRTAGNIELLHVLGGVSPDYSVVAQKEADPELIQQFNGAFATGYGVSLPSLAQRYDKAAHERLEEVRLELHHLLEQASLRSGEAEHKIGMLERRMTIAETRASESEARAAQSSARAEQLALQLIDVYNSTSWRITAPLRMVGGYARRLKSAVREGRLASGLKRRMKSTVRIAGQAALRQPLVARAAMALLDAAPGLKLRLRTIIYPETAAQQVQPPSPLSPSALRIYDQLKRAIEARKH